MNSRTTLVLHARVTLGLFIVLIGAYCIAPSARAQTVMIAGSMDSNLPVRPGDIIASGYQVSLADTSASSTATTVSVTNAVVLVSIKCPTGKSETITVNLSPRSFSVPANSSNWSASATDYQGQTKAPSSLCGGQQGTTNGATFTATSAVSCHANSAQGCCHNVCFRFHDKFNNRGGTFSNTSCKPEKQCESPEMQKHGNCCSKDD
jgi:hypothetical protein